MLKCAHTDLRDVGAKWATSPPHWLFRAQVYRFNGMELKNHTVLKWYKPDLNLKYFFHPTNLPPSSSSFWSIGRQFRATFFRFWIHWLYPWYGNIRYRFHHGMEDNIDTFTSHMIFWHQIKFALNFDLLSATVFHVFATFFHVFPRFCHVFSTFFFCRHTFHQKMIFFQIKIIFEKKNSKNS